LPVEAGFIDADIMNPEALDAAFSGTRFDGVIHFAAFAYVGESVTDPEKYYYNNVAGTLNLLGAMKNHGVSKIVFSSTCATYGVPSLVPITEDEPQNPINPYGQTKLMVERIMDDYQVAYGIDSIRLRYFNAAGGDPEGRTGESHDPETHLIPLILDVAAGKRESITVFGTDYPTPDGTCIRDYIHTVDLADAHIQALKHLEKNPNTALGINLGSGQGFSVKEIIKAVEKVTGKTITIEYGERRPGDPAVLIGDNTKAKTLLGWEPKHSDLSTIISTAWQWYQK
jgi:UDP-glucose 4-epimerase